MTKLCDSDNSNAFAEAEKYWSDQIFPKTAHQTLNIDLKEVITAKRLYDQVLRLPFAASGVIGGFLDGTVVGSRQLLIACQSVADQVAAGNYRCRDPLFSVPERFAGELPPAPIRNRVDHALAILLARVVEDFVDTLRPANVLPRGLPGLWAMLCEIPRIATSHEAYVVDVHTIGELADRTPLVDVVMDFADYIGDVKVQRVLSSVLSSIVTRVGLSSAHPLSEVAHELRLIRAAREIARLGSETGVKTLFHGNSLVTWCPDNDRGSKTIDNWEKTLFRNGLQFDYFESSNDIRRKGVDFRNFNVRANKKAVANHTPCIQLQRSAYCTLSRGLEACEKTLNSVLAAKHVLADWLYSYSPGLQISEETKSGRVALAEIQARFMSAGFGDLFDYGAIKKLSYEYLMRWAEFVSEYNGNCDRNAAVGRSA